MNLDNFKQMKKLDTGQVAESIELLPDQIRQVLEESRLVKIPSEYSRVTSVVVNGMGGSNIGAGIVKSIFGPQIKVPLTITPGYQVPGQVNAKTLFLISSYSGATEEPLSTYTEIKKRKAKILAITGHGPQNKLEKLMMKDNIPGYIFKPQYNPSGQPRLGLGYTLFGTAILLAKAGLFRIQVREIEDIIASMEIWSRKLKPESPIKTNAAKQLAAKLYNKIGILIGAEHTLGNVRALRNQINESSKHFVTYLNLPDLNHFAMEGLANPGTNKKNLVFLFFDSALYHSRVQQRAELTKQVVKKNNIAVISHQLKSESIISQGFELLQLGAWLSYYLGMLNRVDPVKIPWVDWFKRQLK